MHPRPLDAVLIIMSLYGHNPSHTNATSPPVHTYIITTLFIDANTTYVATRFIDG